MGSSDEALQQPSSDLLATKALGFCRFCLDDWLEWLAGSSARQWQSLDVQAGRSSRILAAVTGQLQQPSSDFVGSKGLGFLQVMAGWNFL